MSYINWYPLESHWYPLESRQQDGLTIVVDKTSEDMDPADSFDESCFDIQEIREDIDAGRLDWFILRVRVLLDDVVLGRNIVGGFLYKDASEVLTDGTVDDMLAEAMNEARDRAIKLKARLEELGI